ncbi:MAG: winged helix-turn-helix transcriptional regulator, partial [Deinococcus sp.]|nr:winged helix-turn-helix transcriptional regulator [Deinococcus sp.]
EERLRLRLGQLVVAPSLAAELTMLLVHLSRSEPLDIPLERFERARLQLGGSFFARLAEAGLAKPTDHLVLLLFAEAWGLSQLSDDAAPLVAALEESTPERLCQQLEGWLGCQVDRRRTKFAESILEGDREGTETPQARAAMLVVLENLGRLGGFDPSFQRKYARLVAELWEKFLSGEWEREGGAVRQEVQRLSEALGLDPLFDDLLAALPRGHVARLRPEALRRAVAEGRHIRLIPLLSSGASGVLVSSQQFYSLGYGMSQAEALRRLSQEAQRLSVPLKAIADPTRLRILRAVAQEAWYTGEIAERLGIAQPTASQHLKILRDQGLVDAQQRGNFVYYRLNQERLEAYLDQVRRFLLPE